MFARRLLTLTLALLAVGCTGFPAPTDNGLAPGQRLITGQLLAPVDSSTVGGIVGLQVGAVSFPSGDCTQPKFYQSAAFSPAPNGSTRSTIAFSLTVPCAETIQLFIQPSTGANNTGGQSPIVFPSYSGGPLTASIPGIDTAFTNNGPCQDITDPSGVVQSLFGRRIDLGTFPLPDVLPAKIVIGMPGDQSQNPLTQVDSDADQTDDFDQNAATAQMSSMADGGTSAPLATECDLDNDGIADILEQ